MIKMNRVDHYVIKLKLFPFSLRDKARSWYHNLMPFPSIGGES